LYNFFVHQVYIDSLRTLHIATAHTLGLSQQTVDALEALLIEIEKLLEGVKYIGELTPRTRDLLGIKYMNAPTLRTFLMGTMLKPVVSFGERMSVRIMAGTLNKLGVPSQYFDAWTLGVRTTSNFGNADILEETYANVRTTLGKFDNQIVAVVTGFIGHDSQGRITTLGRGGSDLTATCLGASVGADEIQVWKDVVSESIVCG
jgi:aspartate kinase